MEGKRRQRGYLAQHPLFEQIPELARDVCEPEYCSLGEGDVQSVNAWFGPAGTVRSHHAWLCTTTADKAKSKCHAWDVVTV